MSRFGPFIAGIAVVLAAGCTQSEFRNYETTAGTSSASLGSSVSSRSSSSRSPEYSIQFLKDGALRTLSGVTLKEDDCGHGYWLCDTLVLGNTLYYKEVDRAPAIHTIDLTSGSKSTFYVAQGSGSYLYMMNAKSHPWLYVIEEEYSSNSDGNDPFPDIDHILYEFDPATGRRSEIITKNFGGMRSLSFLGETPSGDVVYCVCSQEGGESFFGEAFYWDRETKTERSLGKFSVEGVGVLADGRVYYYWNDSWLGENDGKAVVRIYDPATRTRKNVLEDDGRLYTRSYSVDPYKNRAILATRSGAVVLDLNNGRKLAELSAEDVMQAKMFGHSVSFMRDDSDAFFKMVGAANPDYRQDGSSRDIMEWTIDKEGLRSRLLYTMPCKTKACDFHRLDDGSLLLIDDVRP